MKLLKNSFEKENLSNPFDKELVTFLEKINPTDVPDNLTRFYYTNINLKNDHGRTPYEQAKYYGKEKVAVVFYMYIMKQELKKW